MSGSSPLLTFESCIFAGKPITFFYEDAGKILSRELGFISNTRGCDFFTSIDATPGYLCLAIETVDKMAFGIHAPFTGG
jgi:hypothetical protein